MEIRRVRFYWLYSVLTALLLLAASGAQAQPAMACTVKQGRLYVQVPKAVVEAALDSFIRQFDLADLQLKAFLKSNDQKLLTQSGWKVEANNEVGLLISKAMEPFTELNKPVARIYFQDKSKPLFPAVNNGLSFGANQFRNKYPFEVKDSVVRFFLRNHQVARRVTLAGSFNNWVPDALAMQKTDSGWIYDVKLGPGKYWYKFIVNGNWIVDKDNLLSENDGRGNTNSVFFRPNRLFSLAGFTEAKKVYLAGSFNQWEQGRLSMQKTENGWVLPLYLAEGTHTYKFIVDGRWCQDPQNRLAVPDGEGGYNSVVQMGAPYLFRLNGFPEAKEVRLVGSFNQWRDFEWAMKKTASGWELPFTLGPGNHAYRYKVDGKFIADPANRRTSNSTGNSYLILEPNHTFSLPGFSGAREVYLAGDFNQWDPRSFSMIKNEDGWMLSVHLSVGKHLYKFIVDGKWIIDPGNKFWEQNEYGNGNSVIWVEE